jgi:hypothetical protein
MCDFKDNEMVEKWSHQLEEESLIILLLEIGEDTERFQD